MQRSRVDLPHPEGADQGAHLVPGDLQDDPEQRLGISVVEIQAADVDHRPGDLHGRPPGDDIVPLGQNLDSRSAHAAAYRAVGA